MDTLDVFSKNTVRGGLLLGVLKMTIYYVYFANSATYDHRTLKTRLPVRSALFKQRTGGLVVRWVTTSEYPLLYVFANSIASYLLFSSCNDELS
jgi:hypothetical protein